MSFIKKLINARENLSISEKVILDYIMNHKIAISDFNVEKIADETYTSASSVVRMCKKLGFSGFKDFKIDYILAKSKTELIKKQVFSSELIEGEEPIGLSIIKQHIQALKATSAIFDQEKIKNIARIIMNAKKILVFGKGNSYLVSKDLELKLKMLGRSCVANDEFHNQMIDQTFMSDKDLVILISNSGRTKELISAALLAKEQKITLVVITSEPNSLLAELSDYVVITYKSKDAFNDEESSSRISQLCMIDAINAECILYNHQDASNKEKRIYEIFKKYVR